MRKSLFVLAIGFGSVALRPLHPPTDTPERRLLRKAAGFMGGEPALRAVRTRQSTWHQAATSLGQEEFPGNPALVSINVGTFTMDYARDLHRQQFVPPGLDPRNLSSIVVDSDRVAVFVRDTARPVGGIGIIKAKALIHRRAALTPEHLVVTALDLPDASLRAAGTSTILGRQVRGVSVAAGVDTVTLWIDPLDGRILAEDARHPDPLFGTRIDREEYRSWATYDGLRIPASYTLTQNGKLVRMDVLVSATFNGAAADSLTRIAATVAPPRVVAAVTRVTELTPGIVRIEGTDGGAGYGGGVPYYTIAVRQADSLLLFETPLDGARTAEILDTLRGRFPKVKPASVIVTHAHYDHIGGVPAAVNRGLRIVTSPELMPFLGTLSMARKPRFLAVKDSMIVGSGDNQLILYRLESVHADGMLIGYVPSQKLLLESDMVGLATPTQQREMASFASAHHLAIDRVAGTHGPIVTWQDFLAKLK
jgi:glyoxylase-like metal-dependent hydrolase (beta-lactamase superfamily II)